MRRNVRVIFPHCSLHLVVLFHPSLATWEGRKLLRKLVWNLCGWVFVSAAPHPSPSPLQAHQSSLRGCSSGVICSWKLAPLITDSCPLLVIRPLRHADEGEASRSYSIKSTASAVAVTSNDRVMCNHIAISLPVGVCGVVSMGRYMDSDKDRCMDSDMGS